MKTQRLFITLSVVIICLVGSIYLAGKKLKQMGQVAGPDSSNTMLNGAGPNTQVGSAQRFGAGAPGQSVGADSKVVVVDQPKDLPIPVVSSPAPETTPLSCTPQKEYLEIRRELGLMVNKHDLREHNIPEFVRLLNEFRTKMGLPLPLQVTSNKLEEQGVVYNNCRSTCKGMVNQVFVSKVIDGRYVEVLMKDSSHKKLPLHESGIEVATVDELNAKGVPFRSWLTPVSSGDWYVFERDLYYGLDIEGTWLKIDGGNNWTVVPKPPGLIRLSTVEPAEKILGCHSDELCLSTPSGAGVVRHFRAPRSCAPVLRHSADEPSNRDENGNMPGVKKRPRSARFKITHR